MRRVSVLALLAAALLAAAVLAGCGSSASKPASAVPTELSYFPGNSPFVITVATDPNAPAIKQAQALEGRFPLAAFGQAALISKLNQLGLNYQSDIRPLFGNPLAFGIARSTLSSSAAGHEYLAVWITKDAAKLSALIKKLPGLHGAGSHGGATLYQSSAAAIAIDGATLVLGPSVASVTAALDDHAQGNGFSSAQYSSLVSGLPQNSLIETFGNLTGVLSSPGAVMARRVPWLAALRGYAASISAAASGLTFQYHLDTRGGSLTAQQLPFATGTAAPSLAGSLPIEFGIRDPAQVVAFAEAAEQATSPVSYAAFLKRQAAIQRRTGVNLNSLLAMLTGDLIIESDTHTTMGRAAVSNPAAAAHALSKLATAPRSVFAKATSITRAGGGFYVVKEPGTAITVGVLGNQLLVGKATPAQLRAFAAAPATPAEGARGAVAFRIALIDLMRIGLKHAPLPTEQAILGLLDNVTGWTAASPTGLSGSATLGLK